MGDRQVLRRSTDLCTISKRLLVDPFSPDDRVPILSDEEDHQNQDHHQGRMIRPGSSRPGSLNQRHPSEQVVGAVGIRTLELTAQRQRRMSRYCCVRVCTSFLHLVNTLISGLLCLYALVGYTEGKECLPPLVDYFGDPIKFTNGIPTMCNAAHCFMIGIFVLNLLMILGVNCLIESNCLMFLHLVLGFVMCMAAVFGATVFSVHYQLWCDSLLQKSQLDQTKCKTAAEKYDEVHTAKNMTWYYDRLELQQIGLWCIADFLILTVLAYLFVNKVVTGRNQSDDESENPNGNFRYVTLNDESTPLVNPMASLSASSCSDFVRDSHVSRGPPPRYQPHEQAPTRRRASVVSTRPRGSSHHSLPNPLESERVLAPTSEEPVGIVQPHYLATEDESRPLLRATRPASAPPDGAAMCPGLHNQNFNSNNGGDDQPPPYPQIHAYPDVYTHSHDTLGRRTPGARSVSIDSDRNNPFNM